MPRMLTAVGEASVVLLFTTSLVNKLRGPVSFAAAVQTLTRGTVPTRIVAASVIVSEAFVVASIALNLNQAAGYLLCVVLLCGFTAVLLPHVIAGKPIHCHCVSADSRAGWSHIALNLTLVVLSLILLTEGATNLSLTEMLAGVLLVGGITQAVRLISQARTLSEALVRGRRAA